MNQKPEDETLKIAHCSRCGAYSLPVNTYGCRACGADSQSLQATSLPSTPKLVNFVTLHVALSPELEVPCVIGEVQLAPGVIEEAVIDVSDESQLTVGMAVTPKYTKGKGEKMIWKFAPVSHTGGAA